MEDLERLTFQQNLNEPCLYCEIPKNHGHGYIWCGFLTCSEGSLMTHEVKPHLRNIFICSLSCSVSMHFSLLWPLFVPRSCLIYELWERGSGPDCKLLQGYIFSRFRWHGRAESIRKAFRWFNTLASSVLFLKAANMVGIDHGLKKRSVGSLTKRHHYRALDCPLLWITTPRRRLNILHLQPSWLLWIMQANYSLFMNPRQ